MESVFETSGTVLIVHLPVDLDHPVSDDIRRESDRIIGRQYIKNMVFDFSETAFMDSSGIGMLMGRYRQISHMGGQMYAVHVGERVRKILDMAGISKVVEIRGV